MHPPASGPKYAPVRFRFLSLLLAVSLLALSIPQGLIRIIPTAEAASANVVVSQVYGGGGNAGATFKNDFIELFNRGTTTVSLAGWSVQYASSAGTSWAVTTLSGSIAPGKYYLVQEGVGAGGTVNLPAPDASGTIAMSATSGKVAVVNSTAALTGACPAAVDFVGFGGANCFEGAPTATLANATAAIRGGNGCNDTDVNSADFTVGAPTPRNSASAANTCGVANNPPAINAPADPVATVTQDAAPFTVSLSGSDDNNIFNWSATAGAGVLAVNVTGGQGTNGATYTVALQPGFSGTATFTASLSDNVNAAVTRAVNVAVTPLVANSPPAINAPANPIVTVAQDAAPFNVGLTGSDDNGVFNWSAVPVVGVSSVSVASGQGTSAVTYAVTLTPGFSGTATFNARLSDNVNPQVTQAVNITVTPAPPPPLDHIVISQLYGGGGNSGATFRNDYVELYNPTTAAIDLGGWTIQYASATGTSWQVQPLGGTMQPGEYYLISLASGGAVGGPLPAANITGSINMSGTTGKVALSGGGDALSGCPVGDSDLVDLVGYGTADCREGAGNAPAPSNTTSIFRKSGGFTDTNVNSADFVTGTPNPRRTTPISELAPSVLSSDPRNNFSNTPRDASITITFTEPVTINDGWFNISCAVTGAHNSATVAPGGANSWIIIPNVNFQAGEQCTVNVVKEFVHDTDLDDAGPNSDQLTKNYTATFTISTGAAPAYPADVHLTMGNPSGATADAVNSPDNYLMVKPEFALSYNRDRGTPNWVSWHLADEWVGSLARVDTFRADPAVPADWYRVTHVDYTNSGFDRGHMTPNADRDPETSSPINQATFLMSNMVPQAPDNNQGPWANMENYLRTLLPANELYIVAGGAGTGGTGSNGGVTNTIANGHVSVPAATWKVALVIPKAGGDDVSRVGCGARTIAVVMPNVQGIRNNDWQGYITTVDAVETLTGYDFFSNLPDAVETCVEAGTNGVNPPGAEDSAYTTAEDTPANVSMTALPSGPGALTYTVVSAPSHGTLAGTGADRTYTPAADFHGADSFTFNVSDGTRTSRTATVSLLVTEVNDAPAAVADEATTDEDTPVSVNVVSNDTDADGNALSLGGVSGATHGSVAVVDGQAVFTPDADYNGPASFDYVVGDGQGGTATGSVSVTVKAVNDAPTANADSFATDEDAAVTVNVRANDTDVEGDTLAVTAVGTPSHGTATLVAGNGVRYTPAANYNGPDSFTYTVSDGNGGTATGTVNMSVAAANDAPVLSGVPASANVNELAAYTFTAQAGDVDGDGLTFSLVGAPAGAGISQAGVFNWTPTEAQGGTGSPYSFTVRVTDGTVNTDSPVTITVNEVNQAPSLAHVGDRVVTLGGTLAFTASGSDADLPAQGLSYGLTGSVPAGASINPTTGAFNWTPTAAQAGHVYAFGVRVTDSGGLFAEEIINVGVGHSWSGFLQPVEADGSSVFKLGRTVPVKFQLTGASAGITDAVARLYVAKVTGNVVGPEQAAVSASNATEGNLFRQTGNHYMFNLSTDGLTAGTYQLRVDMGDGVQRTVLVSFR